jgi:hypothetical protein
MRENRWRVRQEDVNLAYDLGRIFYHLRTARRRSWKSGKSGKQEVSASVGKVRFLRDSVRRVAQGASLPPIALIHLSAWKGPYSIT